MTKTTPKLNATSTEDGILECALTLVEDYRKVLLRVGNEMREQNGSISLKKLISRKLLDDVIDVDYRTVTSF